MSDEVMAHLLARIEEQDNEKTLVQARCTELLDEARELRECVRILYGIIDSAVCRMPVGGWWLEVETGIRRARLKHPDGSTLAALVEEVGEVARAIGGDEGDERVRSELVDVMIVAARLWLGERA